MKEKITLREKLAYGGTDLASNLVWSTVGMYLLYFYTNIMGLEAAAVGTLFFVTRVLDALVDPVAGICIDKTRSRFGKSRPYFIWMAIPLAIMMVLTFTNPNMGSGAKLLYAYVTYGILGVVYSFINLPVTAILPRLAFTSQGRTVLGTFRMSGTMVANLILGALTLPLVGALGGTNPGKGYQVTMILYSLVAVGLFVFAFFALKEKVKADPAQSGLKLSQSLKAMKGNTPWLLILFIGLLLQLTIALRSSSSIYYLTYNMHRQDLIPVMNALMLFILASVAAVPFVVSKIGKRNTMIVGNIVSLAGYLVIYPIGANSIPLLFAGNIVANLGLGLCLSLAFVMISDTVDYGEWKSGVKAEGLLSAAASFGQKVGAGLGASIAAWILGFGHYSASLDVQPDTALSAITLNYAVIPVIGCVLSIALLFLYKLDKVYPKMYADLQAKREEAQAG